MTVKWILEKPTRYKYKNNKPPYKKVCLGIRGQFGDIVMQEPAIRKFIKDNPETKITLAVSKRYEQILPLYENYHDNIIDFKVFEGYEQWPTPEDLKYLETDSVNFEKINSDIKFNLNLINRELKRDKKKAATLLEEWVKKNSDEKKEDKNEQEAGSNSPRTNGEAEVKEGQIHCEKMRTHIQHTTK